MDKIDIAIIRELTQAGLLLPGRPGFAPSNRQVSRKLGIPLGTVRNRIGGMYKSGVIRGSQVYPNPNLLGLNFAAYTLEVSSALKKKEAFRKLKLLDGVFAAHDFIGRRGWIGFVYKDEQDLNRKFSLFNEAAGSHGVISRIPSPPSSESATRSEVELISKLSNNTIADLDELGTELGMPLRTLKRKMSKIVRENMIISMPDVDYSAITECVPTDVLIFFENSEARAKGEPKVLELLGDYIILAALWDVVGMCSLILPKVALAEELAEKIRQIEGVKDAWAEIVVEHYHQGRVLTQYLERQMLSGAKMSRRPMKSVTVLNQKPSAALSRNHFGHVPL